jgi:beta-glucosidase
LKEPWFDESLPLQKRIDALIDRMSTEEKVSQLTDSAAGLSHLGIKQYNWWNEALHGVARAGEATVFPQAIGMAAMWNSELSEAIGGVVSTEARAKYNEAQRQNVFDRYYGLTFWSPNINIFRDPRWGRGHETYGEDPYLTSVLGVSYIKGLQGDGKHLKVAACAKHFAAHSGPEDGRQNFNSIVSKKDLNETYLPAFKACVKIGKVEAVMGAYNALNGIPCCCNKELLTDILRKHWNFNGHVVSDCGAIYNIAEYHKYTEDFVHAAAESLKSGCDLNCGTVYESLTEAYEKDLVTDEDLNNALRHTLGTRFKLGMFDGSTEYDSIPMSVVACEKHMELCLESSRQSLVLLKNDGILPLGNVSGKIAVIGPNADSKEALLGNYCGTPTQPTTVLDGMKEIFGTEKIKYAKGSDIMENDDSLSEAVKLASESETVVLCLGLDARYEGECGDAFNKYGSGDRAGIELPEAQAVLLEKISEVTDNLVLILLSGGATAFDTSAVNAAVQGWYPGELGGKAIAELLYGKFSPSGKLPLTFYKSTDELPDFNDYSMNNRTYRYFRGDVLFPFGFGLSYTQFVKDARINSNEVSVNIKNTGSFDSYEVVQVYLSEKEANNQPIKRLIRFKKVFVKANTNAVVNFSLNENDFFRINDDGEKELISSENFEITIS